MTTKTVRILTPTRNYLQEPFTFRLYHKSNKVTKPTTYLSIVHFTNTRHICTVNR